MVETIAKVWRGGESELLWSGLLSEQGLTHAACVAVLPELACPGLSITNEAAAG